MSARILFVAAVGFLLPCAVPAQERTFPEAVLRVANGPFPDMATLSQEFHIDFKPARESTTSRSMEGVTRDAFAGWKVSVGEDRSAKGRVTLMVVSFTPIEEPKPSGRAGPCLKVGDVTSVLGAPSWRRIVTQTPYREVFVKGDSGQDVRIDVDPPGSSRSNECLQYLQVSFKNWHEMGGKE